MSLELTTERLLLRALHPHDAPALLTIFSAPQTVKHTEWEPFQTLAEAEWLVNWATNATQQEPRTVFVWGICSRDVEDTDLLGIATLTIRDPSLRQADIGYILSRPAWGRGIATEAARAVIEMGFKQLYLHRITAGCSPENKASARVLEKVGMRREGCLIQNKWEKGQWRDTVIFALLKQEYAGSLHEEIEAIQ